MTPKQTVGPTCKRNKNCQVKWTVGPTCQPINKSKYATKKIPQHGWRAPGQREGGPAAAANSTRPETDGRVATWRTRRALVAASAASVGAAPAARPELLHLDATRERPELLHLDATWERPDLLFIFYWTNKWDQMSICHQFVVQFAISVLQKTDKMC